MLPTSVTPVAAVKSFTHHAHLGAIAVDRQFGETSLPFGLDQRPRTRRVRRPSGRVSGIDVSIGTIAPALPSGFTGMRKIWPPKNVFTYTAPSARIAMPSTPASC